MSATPHPDAAQVSRRRFLSLGVTAVVGVVATDRRAAAQDPAAGQGPSGRLWDPNRAGRPQTPTTERDSDPAVQALEKRIRCTCGCGLDVYTCRTTDFTCTTSPAMHRQVLALLDRGLTPDQVVQAFVDEHGQSVLMAPPKQGFNLAAYFVPGILILAAGAVLLVVLRRWTRLAAPAPAAPVRAPEGSPEELAQLQRELDDFSA